MRAAAHHSRTAYGTPPEGPRAPCATAPLHEHRTAQPAPLVLSARSGNRDRVHAACPEALALGIRPGMSLTRARALVEPLTVIPATPADDARRLEALGLRLLETFSPHIGVDPPDGLLLETTGVDHLFGGETALMEALERYLRDLGLTPRLALADTPAAARALARHGARTCTIAPAGTTRTHLAPLPLEALRLPETIRDGLLTLGFERIGDLLKRPRAPLARRFGPVISLRLDQALGDVDEPFRPLRARETPQARMAFAEPVGTGESIAAAANLLARSLCHTLQNRGLGGRVFDLFCHRVDHRVVSLRIRTSTALHDPARLARLFRERIDTLDPGFGIETMILRATATLPLAPARQTTTDDGDEGSPASVRDLSPLVDILVNRLGGQRVYTLRSVESDVPERSVVRIPVLSRSDRDPPPGSGAGTGTAPPWPRPVRLLTPPESIDALALLPDRPPRAFTWRGTRYRVVCADGPERIFGEWWKRPAEQDAVRDYFRLETDTGERYWVYRLGDGENPDTGSGRWFLQGFFA
ncbi:DUF6504 family protein [Phaeovibrio sulfidiphilus]|uniref:DUF6504 family protein n=1 Tax=Phaeovibrio sulfidiphilus TaxID=1220600 RepID=UPI0018D62627